MTENERDRIKALEVRMEGTNMKLDKMESQLTELVFDMHERRGREAAERQDHIEHREDKWQTWNWIRAFLPVTIILAIWAAIVEVFRLLTGTTP